MMIEGHWAQWIFIRIDGETLKSFASHWPPQRWQEYEPLLTYCRDNGVRIVACGTPLEVSRTVQAEDHRLIFTFLTSLLLLGQVHIYLHKQE
ncbi:hypothetical protein ACSBR2_001529 [Camellia fascicularis]